MLNKAGAWLEQLERKSMIVEIPDQCCSKMGGKGNLPGWSLFAGWMCVPGEFVD